MLPIRNISYLLPMCYSFWEKYKNSPKTGLGCSTPLKKQRGNWEAKWPDEQNEKLGPDGAMEQ